MSTCSRDTRTPSSVTLATKTSEPVVPAWGSHPGRHLAHRPKRFHRRIDHDLGPVPDEGDPQSWGQH